MIDPKMLELSVYEGIPHLLAPVVTDMKEAANGLRWCVAEMERRYKLMSAVGVRNLAGFNKKVQATPIDAGQPMLDPLFKPNPELDEAPRAARAAAVHRGGHRRIRRHDDGRRQEGRGADRAAGAEGARRGHPPDPGDAAAVGRRHHRPDQGQHPDPHRLPGVSSKIDSRTILDQSGAETLLGHGDMLYLPPGTAMPERVHGAFVSDEEVHRVVEHMQARAAAAPTTSTACWKKCSRMGDGVVVGATGLPESGGGEGTSPIRCTTRPCGSSPRPGAHRSPACSAG